MATDWTALRIEYINGSMQYKELADAHKLKEGTVRQRANREDWAKERNALSRAVTQTANASLVESRSDQLASFNADDVRIAKAIRAKAAKMLGAATSPQDLRALSGAFDTAQKIGRLALGASTENSNVSTVPSGLNHFYGDD